MQYDFLKQFPRRMKQAGRYALLFLNSSQKTIWKQYGFLKYDEQVNMIFAVMLYLMEQSLKEEICTVDDICAYIDSLNMDYLKKPMSYEDCRKLGDFILNVVLSNEGRPMYFDGFDFEQKAYHIMNISYVANRVVYVDNEVRRTSYYLTEDGYSLLLSTLEIESNMKLTIHEMIFKMHLEKQSYDKAVDEIKNVFNLLRIQLQKIQEAMGRIKRNALNYSVAEYEEILGENLETITDTQQKFQNYRDLVKIRVGELEEIDFNIRKLDEKEKENLENLRIIEGYLNRTIDEHQRILSSHFDLKALYTRELEQLSKMSLIKRFSFRNDFYEKLIKQPEGFERMDIFLRPLFQKNPGKIYNLKKSMELQRPLRKKKEEAGGEFLDFGSDEWQKEEEKKLKEKNLLYRNSLWGIVDAALHSEKGELTLEELQESIKDDEEKIRKLIPSVEIFKEIMVELLRTQVIDIGVLRKEKREFLSELGGGFQLNEMLLSLADEMVPEMAGIEAYRIEDKKTVCFFKVFDEDGKEKQIRCSNVLIRVRLQNIK